MANLAAGPYNPASTYPPVQPVSGTVTAKLQDGSGNAISSGGGTTITGALNTVVPLASGGGNITTAANSAVTLQLFGSNGEAKILITGTWTGTLTFQGSVDGGTYTNINADVMPGTGLLSAATTANGTFAIDSTGFQAIRVLGPTNSGSAAISIIVGSAGSSIRMVQSLPAGTNVIGKVTAQGVDSTGTAQTINTDNRGDVNIGSANISLQSLFESTAGWTANAQAINFTTTTTHVGPGTNFLTFDKTTGGTSALISITIPSQDLSAFGLNSYGLGAVYLPSLTNISSINVRFGSNSSNYTEWDFAVANLKVGWNNLEALVNNPSSQVGAGAISSALTYFAFGVTTAAAGDTVTGVVVGGLAVKRSTLVFQPNQATVNTSGEQLVAANITALTQLQNTQLNVSTTAVQLDPSALTGRKSIAIKALSTNTPTIWVGQSNAVTPSSGFPLTANEAVTYEISETQQVWAITSSDTGRVAVSEIK